MLFPALDRAGVPVLWNQMICVVGMFPLLLGASLAAYKLEGRPSRCRDLLATFRIGALDANGWRWTIGLLVIFVGGQLLLSPTVAWLASRVPLPMPRVLPGVLDPRVPKTAIPTEFLGVPLAGN